jgi:hypothetical protein
LMTKFGKSRKANYLISHFGLFNFGSFRTKPRKESNLKI